MNQSKALCLDAIAEILRRRKKRLIRKLDKLEKFRYECGDDEYTLTWWSEYEGALREVIRMKEAIDKLIKK